MATLKPTAAVSDFVRQEATMARDGRSDDAPHGSNDILCYATGDELADRRGWLVAVGVAQAIIGAGLLWVCVRTVGRLYLYQTLWSVHSVFDALLLAFLFFGTLAGFAHVFAATDLLVPRRARRTGVVRAKPQRRALASLLPLLLVGVATTLAALRSIYRGNDPFAGIAVAFGIGLCVIAAAFAMIAWAAARRLGATYLPPAR